MRHFIHMNGEPGCMPDSVGVTLKKKDAIESLGGILEFGMGSSIARKLASSGLHYFHANHKEVDQCACRHCKGAGYCEVTECNCEAPWEHDEEGLGRMTEEEWLEDLGFATPALENKHGMSWGDVLDIARKGGMVRYQAPMDYAPVAVAIRATGKNPKKVRVLSQYPFWADAEHLDRISPYRCDDCSASMVNGRLVHESGCVNVRGARS